MVERTGLSRAAGRHYDGGPHRRDLASLGGLLNAPQTHRFATIVNARRITPLGAVACILATLTGLGVGWALRDMASEPSATLDGSATTVAPTSTAAQSATTVTPTTTSTMAPSSAETDVPPSVAAESADSSEPPTCPVGQVVIGAPRNLEVKRYGGQPGGTYDRYATVEVPLTNATDAPVGYLVTINVILADSSGGTTWLSVAGESQVGVGDTALLSGSLELTTEDPSPASIAGMEVSSEPYFATWGGWARGADEVCGSPTHRRGN